MDNLENDKLISFLQNLIIAVEQGNLTNKQYSMLSEFYTYYKFKDRNKENHKFQTEDYIKFLTLGWYIYSLQAEQQDSRD
jgi:hypothetical protein